MASTSGISHHYTCNANHLGIESYIERKEKAVKESLNVHQEKVRIRYSYYAYAFLYSENFSNRSDQKLIM